MRLSFALFIAIAACTQFPELDQTIAPSVKGAEPPALVPLSTIIARANAANGASQITIDDMTSRLTGLQNRAARLRGPVIAPATRARMLRGVR